MKPGLGGRKRVRSAGMALKVKAGDKQHEVQAAGCKWEAVRDASGKRKRCKQEAAIIIGKQ